MMFAATYPSRTTALILVDAYARALRADDYPLGASERELEVLVESGWQVWGTGATGRLVAPSVAADPPFREWYARLERATAPPEAFAKLVRWGFGLDVRAILSSIRVPTFGTQHEIGPNTMYDHGSYLVDRIEGARLRYYGGDDSFPFSSETPQLVDEIEEFITGEQPPVDVGRVLASLLFTDIVDSTATAARLGDRAWKDLLERHDADVAGELVRRRGNKVHSIGQGDGVLATLDGPARSILCARAIVDGVRRLGIEARAGVQTGEIEVRAEGDVGGIAVHIAARVREQAGAGEVLVSGSVPPLVAGSGITFSDRGTHALKGVPDESRLFAVES
jgi:class 3 adenylate cyclase